MITSAISAALSQNRRPAPPGPRRWLTDIAIAAGVFALQTGAWAAMSARHVPSGQPDAGALAYVLLAVGAAALIARRRYPVPVLAIAMITALAAPRLGAVSGWFVLIVAFVNAVLYRERWAAIAALVIGYVVSVWPPWLIGTRGHTPAAVALGLLAGLIALLSAAELSRARGQRLLAVRRGRQEEARRRASDERLAMARDLHDVVAHNISVINIQAKTALHLMDRQPERAREALTAIHEVSRQALGELSSVLGVLRADGADAPLAPSPGLDRLEELAGHARSAGIAVTLVFQGAVRPVAVDVDLAAYRIVQEALTNAVRHSGGTSATVRVCFSEDTLVIEVADDGGSGGGGSGGGGFGGGGFGAGRRGAGGVGGNGLAGMTERARALGGTLDAGPGPGGGFRVLARLPA